MTTCGTCLSTWTGMRIEHCPVPGCHQTFASDSAGDKHRTGNHAVSTGPDRRRCLTVAEMEEKGMVKNARGHWMTAATTPENAPAFFARSAEQTVPGGQVHPKFSSPSQQYESEVDCGTWDPSSSWPS